MRVCINTDNMALANTDLQQEYLHCVQQMGFTEDDLVQMNIYAAEAAFIDEKTREIILMQLRKKKQ